MRQLRSDEARRQFRDLLDEVQRDPAAAIQILRYDKPVAVVVSAEWYEKAAKTMDMFDPAKVARREARDQRQNER